MTVTSTELLAFCEAVSEKIETHNASFVPKLHEMFGTLITFEEGKKFARIVKGGFKRETGELTNDRSVFCFVDLESGSILKADGWKRPAKGSRGHIRNGAAEVGPYGPAYLR